MSRVIILNNLTLEVNFEKIGNLETYPGSDEYFDELKNDGTTRPRTEGVEMLKYYKIKTN